MFKHAVVFLEGQSITTNKCFLLLLEREQKSKNKIVLYA